jgi:hypothetical protein
LLSVPAEFEDLAAAPIGSRHKHVLRGRTGADQNSRSQPHYPAKYLSDSPESRFEFGFSYFRFHNCSSLVFVWFISSVTEVVRKIRREVTRKVGIAALNR